MDNKIYGYCRISTKHQSIDRQERNILETYPKAIIVKEVFTGTDLNGREKLKKIIKNVKAGDTIVFDSVSRMTRDAEVGFKVYERLFEKGINLIFLNEPHINTDTYKQAFDTGIEMTGTDVDFILQGINKYLLALAKEQIKIAFDQAEKEVQDLRQRTRQGIETARIKGKQIGQPKGAKLVTKKSIESKQEIIKYNKDFDGLLNDKECMRMIGISRNTFYKYKKELKQEQQQA